VYFRVRRENEYGKRLVARTANGFASVSVAITDGVQQMGLTHVTVALKGLGTSAGTYEADFLVDTEVTHCLAPAGKLKQRTMIKLGHTGEGLVIRPPSP
jgi:hypothetical protein